MSVSHDELRLDVYPVVIHLFVCSNVCESRNHRKVVKIFGVDNNEERSPLTTALCLWNDDQFGILIPVENLRHDDIAHEIFHATVAIMEHLGNKLSGMNDEAYAYLCSCLTRFVYRTLRNQRISVVV